MRQGVFRRHHLSHDPINALDPLGLLNPTKAITSLANAANAGRLYASGFLKLGAAAGLVGTGVGAPVGIGVGLLGAWNIYSATAAQSRALQQWNEAIQAPWSNASLRNFLGVLPYGQMFDDPCEPTPVEFLKEKYETARTGLSGMLELIKEFGTMAP